MPARKMFSDAVETLSRELAEVHEQQSATSDILRVIANSPADAQPVFDAIQSDLRHYIDSASQFDDITLLAVRRLS